MVIISKNSIRVDQKFGKLKVLSVPKTGKFSCVCDCGKICKRNGWELVSGRSISCGCTKKTSLEFLVGHRNDKFEIIGFSRSDDGKPIFTCKCACGVIVKRHYLSNTITKVRSCGCAHTEGGQKKRLNLVGNVYDKLTVLSRESFGSRKKNNWSTWKCECACGNICSVTENILLRKFRKSCGCLQEEKMKNRVGLKTERLQIIAISPGNSRRRTFTFKCDCGKTIQKVMNWERVQKARSCGCIQKEKVSKQARERNILYRVKMGFDPNVPMQSKRIVERLNTRKAKKEALQRDKFCCILCGSRKQLHVHHIYPFYLKENLRSCLKNLAVLCKICHLSKAHKGKSRELNLELQKELIEKYKDIPCSCANCTKVTV